RCFSCSLISASAISTPDMITGTCVTLAATARAIVGTANDSPACSIPENVLGVNPSEVTVISNGPGATAGNLNWPSESETATWGAEESSRVSLRCAPDTKEPLGSTTVPLMSPTTPGGNTAAGCDSAGWLSGGAW